jgi:hypothetical protein
VDDDWLKVFRVPPAMIPLPYLTLGEGWAARQWQAGVPARSLARPVAGVWVHLPISQSAHLELSAYSLGAPAALELRLGTQVVGTYSVGPGETLIHTPPLTLPAGQSLLQAQTDPAAGTVVFTRIELVEENQP